MATPSQADSTTSPLIRLTRAIDPSTTPLRLRKAWILRLPSPPGPTTMTSLQRLLKALQRDHGADALRHVKTIRKGEDGGSSSSATSSLDAVLAYQAESGELSEHSSALALVRKYAPDLLQGQNGEAEDSGQALRAFDIPTTPIPTRSRIAEWNAVWPCVLRMTGPTQDADAKRSAASATSSSASIAFVDRAQDARLWASGSDRLRWAQAGFRACIEQAVQGRRKGDLPIAAYTTTAFNQNAPDSAVEFLPVAAHDTRTTSNHPLRHAVLNVIRTVADQRTAQRRQAAALTGHDQDQASNSADAEAALDAARSSAENGQDYLLNSLSLFVTHEPCPFCTMALVHSRVRQVFFLLPSPGAGACCGARSTTTRAPGGTVEEAIEGGQGGGSFSLHEQAGLNHHFEVWRWAGDWADVGLFDGRRQGSDSKEELADLADLDIGGINA